jgi:hypothetical protein
MGLSRVGGRIEHPVSGIKHLFPPRHLVSILSERQLG